MSIDFDSFFRNRIETLLIRASWMGGLREILGLRGFSQIWHGNAQWYFWLHDAPGAYCLAFVEGDTVQIGGKRFYEGSFALKCYPYSNDRGYAGYSAEEQFWLASNRFDETQTPGFEASEEIPDTLFTVGAISLLLDPQGALALLTFESLDAFKTLDRMDGTGGFNPLSLHVIRNVPGWRHGRPLFDCLVGLYANFINQTPSFMGATRSQGFEYWILPDRSAECGYSDKTSRLCLSIGFTESKCRSKNPLEALWRTRLEVGEEIVASRNLPSSFADGNCAAPSAHFTLNPTWWEAARSDFQSELSSTCGCGDHDCHHPAGQCP
jgi:hypothetical protein